MVYGPTSRDMFIVSCIVPEIFSFNVQLVNFCVCSYLSRSHSHVTESKSFFGRKD